MTELTHIDRKGKAKMVEVGGKPDQERRAVANGRILLGAHTVKLIMENEMKKGDVLTVAQIAGIQAAKKTPSLIPLCHNIFLSGINVKAEIFENGVEVTAEVISQGKTGVEMEALTAVSVALLTVYDMCKAVDKQMVMEEVKLLSKEKR